MGFQDSQEFILRHFLMLIRLPAEKIVGVNTVVFRQPLHLCNRGGACSALVFADYGFGHVYSLSHLALSHLFLCSEFNQSASCYGRRLLFLRAMITSMTRVRFPSFNINFPPVSAVETDTEAASWLSRWQPGRTFILCMLMCIT